ncbi:hypothetical protein AA0Z99_00230 [Agrococcus sp. 1P02AA]|uniref:hypothetical protein n=1 Tax=Agrococcus sp. 1P02AA TaxID=3132259 RepID=UPI0039A65A3C
MIRIRRDGSFTYRGEQWLVLGGGPATPNADFGYELWCPSRSVSVDGFFRMSDIRAYLAEAEANGWPLEE